MWLKPVSATGASAGPGPTISSMMGQRPSCWPIFEIDLKLDMHSHKGVTAYWKSKQLLPFGFVWQCSTQGGYIHTNSCGRGYILMIPGTVASENTIGENTLKRTLFPKRTF